MHLYDILKEASAAEPFDCELKKDEPMERYTSFRIGGPCDVMATPKSEEDLVRLIRFLRRERIRTTVIGNATNLLVSDAGIRGVVVRVFGVADVCTREEGTCLRLGAGALLSKAAVFAMRQSLTGFEFAHGIPGAVGGAVMDADLLLEQIAHAAEDGVDCEILFLDCDVPTLINRYKETRRRHPLDNGCGVSAAINLEHDVMEKLKNSARYVIDTTSFSPQRLKKHIRQLFGAEGGHFVISIISFGFKHGIPTEADTVFDVRFLPNPFYDVQLRPLTGENGAVRDYVFRGGMAEQFMGYVHEMLDFLIPQYKEGERSSFVVAIGCTGGQHRSVACACELADYLRLKGNDVILVHRDAQKVR